MLRRVSLLTYEVIIMALGGRPFYPTPGAFPTPRARDLGLGRGAQW